MDTLPKVGERVRLRTNPRVRGKVIVVKTIPLEGVKAPAVDIHVRYADGVLAMGRTDFWQHWERY